MLSERKGPIPHTKSNVSEDDYYKGDSTILKQAVGSSMLERSALMIQEKLVLVMVGLPARGKSYLSRKIEMFLRWKGMNAQLFNVGKQRRAKDNERQSSSADFYSASNEEAKRLREEIAFQVVDELLKWLDTNNGVAILDATNSTDERRNRVLTRCTEHDSKIRVVFVEVICDDETVLQENMKQKIANSPDFAGIDPAEALISLKQRIANYEKAYQTITDDKTSYIKLFNMQSKVHLNKIYGNVSRSLLPYIMSLHVHPRPIYLIRAGMAESPPHAPDQARLPKAAALSDQGRIFAEKLRDFLVSKHSEYTVFCSTLPRTIETAQRLPWDYNSLVMLNPIDTGDLGKTPEEEIETTFPEFYRQFQKDPFRTRYPGGGESYFDVMSRLEPVVVEIESHVKPVVVISHVDTIQVLYCYFLGIPIVDCSQVKIQKNEVIELIPTVGGTLHLERYMLDTRDIRAGSFELRSADMFSILHTAQEEQESKIIRKPSMLAKRGSICEIKKPPQFERGQTAYF
eukprot:c18145_g1_i3.p1 GENE.c18145_g1_i3~~c18145_g1_i3.p1  ORF type:complete len:515 (+),score=193.12 c18145_g1_i3:69-1613(+)